MVLVKYVPQATNYFDSYSKRYKLVSKAINCINAKYTEKKAKSG